MEYGLLLVLVAVIAILGLSLFGVNVTELYQSAVQSLKLSPQDIESCKKVYRGDFNEKLADWEEMQGKTFNSDGAEVEDGKLILEPLNGIILKSADGDDYQINLSGITTEDLKKVNIGFGVVFRASQNSKGLNGYVFKFEKVKQKDTGVMYFSKYVNGIQIPYTKFPVPAGFDFNDPGDVTVDVRGDTFIAYRNGQPILKQQDNTYTSGSAGVIANKGTRLFLDTFEMDSSPLGCEK